MSRRKLRKLTWGKILKQIRKDAGLTQEEIAEAIGYKQTGKGQPKGNVSLIESCKISIDEEKIRLWCQRCKRPMTDFYVEAGKQELVRLLSQPMPPPGQAKNR